MPSGLSCQTLGVQFLLTKESCKYVLIYLFVIFPVAERGKSHTFLWCCSAVRLLYYSLVCLKLCAPKIQRNMFFVCACKMSLLWSYRCESRKKQFISVSMPVPFFLAESYKPLRLCYNSCSCHWPLTVESLGNFQVRACWNLGDKVG